MYKCSCSFQTLKKLNSHLSWFEIPSGLKYDMLSWDYERVLQKLREVSEKKKLETQFSLVKSFI